MKRVLLQYLSFVSEIFATMITLCVILASTCLVMVSLIKHLIRRRYEGEHQKNDVSVGFFHPYCNAGGGGERVLWCAVKALQSKYPTIRCVVYTGDTDAKPEEILEKATRRFNIRIEKPVEFIYLRNRFLVEPHIYPIFTLLGQSLGSIFLGAEALSKFVPTIYMDTMGYAFTYPLFKYLGGCQVACYIHYPTISTDMLARVTRRSAQYNNAGFIARSPLLSFSKLLYYNLFAAMYGFMGRCSDVTLVNSSWTEGHIKRVWKNAHSVFKVYPPCDVTTFEDIPLEPKFNKSIISVAQFRPEKDHQLQLQALALLLKSVPEEQRPSIRLILIGGCRNHDDEVRVAILRNSARTLGIIDNVEFMLNVSFEDLKICFSNAAIGLHTMWNEHFGIGVVECMAAGVIMLANNSGGPKMDIVTDYEGKPTGFLAKTAEEYAEKLKQIFRLNADQQLDLKNNARKSVRRFGETQFNDTFLNAVKSLFRHDLTTSL